MRIFKVKVNGKSYDVEVEETGGTAEPRISAPVQAAEPEKKPVNTGGTPLKSPLPGLILNFKVAAGATVKKGQVVLELEAMKMANDIAANCDGIITFTVQKGATVNTGDILATIA